MTDIEIQAYCTIDAGMFMLREMFSVMDGRTTLEKMIDDATGVNSDNAKTVSEILTEIRDSKIVLGENVDTENQILEKIKNL